MMDMPKLAQDIVLPEMQEGLWYLASPYSHPDATLRDRRFRAVARVAGHLAYDHKVRTFCPIAHSHPIEVELAGEITDWKAHQEGDKGYKLWLEWDFLFLPVLRGAIVCCLPGWESSYGISKEVPKFRGEGKHVAFLDPQPWFSRGEWEDLGGDA